MSSASSRKVLITEDAVREIKRLASTAHPFETGGVAVGLNASGLPWVTWATEVKPISPNRTRFTIPPGTRPIAVAEARALDPRLGYIGDWHSHPANVPASWQDKAALLAIALSRKVDRGAVSIVIRRNGEGYEVDCLALGRRGIVSVELEMTGPVLFAHL